jgi:hypothetical protein
VWYHDPGRRDALPGLRVVVRGGGAQLISSTPDIPDPDPFGGFGDPPPWHIPRRQSASSVVRKVLAGLMLLAGAGIVLAGAVVYAAGKAADIWHERLIGHATIWAGLGVCALAFALYDRRGPFAFLRRKKRE